MREEGKGTGRTFWLVSQGKGFPSPHRFSAVYEITLREPL